MLDFVVKNRTEWCGNNKIVQRFGLAGGEVSKMISHQHTQYVCPLVCGHFGSRPETDQKSSKMALEENNGMLILGQLGPTRPIMPEIITYNAVSPTMRRSQHSPIVPVVITYSAAISACEKGTLPQRALQLFEPMLHQGLLPDVIIYNAWISACEKGHATEESLAALRANAASKPPARRDHLQRLDQCLQKGHATAESLCSSESQSEASCQT